MGLLRACVLAIALKAVIISGTPFSWKNCAKPGAAINVTHLLVEPSPLVLPGDMVITVDGSSSLPLSHTSLDLTFKRKTFFGEILIPCVANVGSCKYHDMCTLIGEMEKNNYAGISAELGKQIDALLKSTGVNLSQCPQPATLLHVDHQHIHMPAVPSILSLFASVSTKCI